MKTLASHEDYSFMLFLLRLLEIQFLLYRAAGNLVII